MERSEPTLVPEWLRSTGSVTGGGSSAHNFASSSSHSDVQSLVHHTRNRNSKSISEFDNPRLALLDRSSSSNSRRSSSNGSSKHAYSSFSRGNRDKDREKERSSFSNHWDSESTDPLGNILGSRGEKVMLQRSQSMVSRKQGDAFTRKVSVDVKNGSNSNPKNGNGVLSGSSLGGSIQKAVFDKDFPSLGAEERHGIPEIGRVSSPVQTLPVSSSALIGGEGWTSALAEVPSMIGSSSMGSLSVQQTVAATSGSGTTTAMAGLNMAEALAQAPSRTRALPQLSVKTQRLEELAIKQSRQLIPVTPSMPKISTLNSSDKAKPKTAVRIGEMNSTTKGAQQQPSSVLHANQSLGGHVKTDAPKTSHGKLLVLKPARQNGVSTPKDVSSPTSNANSKVSNNQPAAALTATSVPTAASTPLRSPNNLKISAGERKAATSNPIPGFALEKRPTVLQTQSRNDFFNLIKKKTSNTSTAVPDSGSVTSSLTMEKSDTVADEAVSAVSSHAIENGIELTSNGDTSDEVQRLAEVREKSGSSIAPAYTDEEEVAFLRSLGWDENSGEDEGLTEEEISAFFQQYMKLRPSLKVSKGIEPKLPESDATNFAGRSSELSSSDSESEA